MKSSISNYCSEGIEFLLLKQLASGMEDYLSTIQSGRMTKDHRRRLTEWIFELSADQGLPHRSVQQAIHIIDCFLSKIPIKSLSTLEIIGLVSISLCLKYEHGGKISPSEIQKNGCAQVPKEAYIYTEIMMAKTLGWDMEKPTASEFLSLIFEATCEKFDYSSLLRRAEDYMQVCYCNYDICLQGPFSIAVACAICVFEDLRYCDFKDAWVSKLSQDFGLDLGAVERIVESIHIQKPFIPSEDTSTCTSNETN